MHSPTVLLSLASLLAALPAQKFPLPGEPNRILQIVDLSPLRPDSSEQASQPGWSMGFDAFVRPLIEPALGPDDAVSLLGDHRLAIIGSPVQAAWVEDLVAAGKEHHGSQIFVDLKFLQVPADIFAAECRPCFGDRTPTTDAARPAHAILPQDALDPLLVRLRKRGCGILQTPKLCALPLSHSSIAVGESIPYVRDYAVTAKDATSTVEPLRDVIFDGDTADLMAAFVGGDRIAVHFEVARTRVQKPLPEVAITLAAGKTIAVQVPHADTVRIKDSLVLPNGGHALLATQQADGSCLVIALTLLRIH